MKQIHSMIQTTTMPCWGSMPQLLQSSNMARLDASRSEFWLLLQYSTMLISTAIAFPGLFTFGLLNCNCLFSGFGERGFRHSQSNSYHPHGTYCGLLSEDQTASQMLSSASRCHGQEWVHAGKICYFCITFLLFLSFVYICEGSQSSRSW